MTIACCGGQQLGPYSQTIHHAHTLPSWQYQGVTPERRHELHGEDPLSLPSMDGPDALVLGTYQRKSVSNLAHPLGRAYFDLGLRLLFSYQHELACKHFLACLEHSPDCALAHGFVALCHSPNYNFKGDAYYNSTNHPEEYAKNDLICNFPSQQVAERHGKKAIEKIEEIRRLHRRSKKKIKSSKGKGRTSETDDTLCASPMGQPTLIADVEIQLLLAIRTLTCSAGISPSLSEQMVGRPFANAMRVVHDKYSDDPEITFVFAEALLVLNAWNLYEFPSGKPLSSDVEEVRSVLERGLELHPEHAGLCHLYVHLSEMSSQPELALSACVPLRSMFLDAGHLIHMPTHIDVLVGDYDSCVRYNSKAIVADRRAMNITPSTAGKESFYFGYIVHDYHMAVYGSILGGFESKAMEFAKELNEILTEDMFNALPDLAAYLETYAALEVHAMIRFGRWKELLELPLPKDERLMLYRAASIHFARALSFAVNGDIEAAEKESRLFDQLRVDPDAEHRILHNNTVKDLLAVDSVMMHGEIEYRKGNYEEAFTLLRQAVKMQDNLNFDEPWGKMQPIRHALGGLLHEQGYTDEAIAVFKEDLKRHPNNPFALVGLIACLKGKSGTGCCSVSDNSVSNEINLLTEALEKQRKCEWADYEIVAPCACCQIVHRST